MFKKVCKCGNGTFVVECETTNSIKLRCVTCDEVDPITLSIGAKSPGFSPNTRNAEGPDRVFPNDR